MFYLLMWTITMKRFHKGCAGTLVLRLVIGAVFLYHGITKLLMPSLGMMEFVGGAATNLGLTFLSNESWFWIVAIVETVGGAMLVLGLCTRCAAVALGIVMLFALNTKGWMLPTAELDYVLLGTLIALLFSGSKRYSLDHLMGCKCYSDDSHHL